MVPLATGRPKLISFIGASYFRFLGRGQTIATAAAMTTISDSTARRGAPGATGGSSRLGGAAAS